MSASSRSKAEWIVFGASLAVLVGLIAVILVVWAGGESPATLVVDPGDVRESAGAYFVDATVSNEGDSTAANVQVIATLTIGDTQTEVEQVVDFVTGGEDAALVFVFQDDPAGGELELVVGSFADP